MAKIELSHGDIARQVMDQLHMRLYQSSIYVYDKGTGYRRIDNRQLEAAIHKSYNEWRIKNSGKDIKQGTINETIHYIERELWDANISGKKDLGYEKISLENGILDIGSLKVVDNTPDIFVPNRIPVKYDPDAECPNIDAFFEDVMNNEKDDILTLEEIFGYTLEYSQFLKKGIILLGKRHSGKTTTFSLMGHFLGNHNISRLDLYAFADRFNIHDIVGKLVNIGDDFGKDTLSAQARGLLKQLTGGALELMTRKPRSTSIIKFNPTIKFYFGCNELPSIKMTDDAFIERWNIVEYLNEYPKDDKFLSSLVTEGELSGLLIRALEGLKRLRKNKQFTKSKRQGYDELYELFEKAKFPDQRRIGDDELKSMKDYLDGKKR